MPDYSSLPPAGNSKQGQKYVSKLTKLIYQDRLIAEHSDLKKFDLSCMQDHYRLNLENYEVELSHSKHPTTGDDMFVLLFNGLKSITNIQDKAILSYIHLNQDQFQALKMACDQQIARTEVTRQQARFEETMAPIDQALDSLQNDDSQTMEQPKIEQIADEPLLSAPEDMLLESPEEQATQQPAIA